MAEDIPCKAYARPPSRRVVVLVSTVASGWIQACDIQARHTAAINKWILPGVVEVRIQIANVATIIMEGA